MTENYKIPTLISQLGLLATAGLEENERHILQICVPEGYNALEVARELNKHTGMVTYCPALFAGYQQGSSWVYIAVAKSAFWRLSSIRNQINNALCEIYGPGSTDVEGFLRAIRACSDGCKFALRYDSMWDVWNAMIDYEQWDYLRYVVNRIQELTADGELKEFELTHLKDISKVSEFCKTSISGNCSMFSAIYLKSINPFKRPEGRNED